MSTAQNLITGLVLSVNQHFASPGVGSLVSLTAAMLVPARHPMFQLKSRTNKAAFATRHLIALYY
jgi:hypothetical protein